MGRLGFAWGPAQRSGSLSGLVQPLRRSASESALESLLACRLASWLGLRLASWSGWPLESALGFALQSALPLGKHPQLQPFAPFANWLAGRYSLPALLADRVLCISLCRG